MIRRLLAAAFLAGIPAWTGGFTHPGLLNSEAELDVIRANVNGPPGHPMQLGWQELKGFYRAGLDHEPKPEAQVTEVHADIGPSETNFRDDAHAAYAHALEWVVTGNIAHAQKAIRILNAWSAVFEKLVPDDKQNQLEAAWLVPIWAAGAEIVRHYRGGAAGWAPADVARFSAMMDKLYAYIPTTFEEKRKNNWGSSAALAAMALGVFEDDSAKWKTGTEYFRYLLPSRWRRAGSSWRPAATATTRNTT